MIDLIKYFSVPSVAEHSAARSKTQKIAAAYALGAGKKLRSLIDQADDAVALSTFDSIWEKISKLPPSFGGWRPEIGTALFQMGGKGRTGVAILQYLLAFPISSSTFRISVDIGESTSFFFNGWIFELAGAVSVNLNNNQLKICCENSGAIALELEMQNDLKIWRLCSATVPISNAPEYVQTNIDSSLYVLAMSSKSSKDELIDWLPESDVVGEIELSQTQAADVQMALGILKRSSPRYHDYVRDILRGVAGHYRELTAPYKNGSSTRYSGLINCSFPSSPEVLGEILVHECSHQYCILLGSVFPLTNDDDATNYYSPIKDKSRKVDKILLAHHACVNMCYYWYDLMQVWGEDEVRVKSFGKFFDMLCQTEDILLNSPGLTEAGTVFFQRMLQVTDLMRPYYDEQSFGTQVGERASKQAIIPQQDVATI